jgi:exopolysaccharide biosynthesis polyprenyl glycosylphosphotransferase
MANGPAALDERTLDILARSRKYGVAKRRGWLVRRVLLACDVVALTSSFLAAAALSGARRGPLEMLASSEFLAFTAALPVWVVLAHAHALYHRDEERPDHTTVDDLGGVFHVVTIGAALFAAIGWLTGVAHVEPGELLLFWPFAVASILTLRAAARALFWHRASFIQNTVIVGAGDVGQLLARKLVQRPAYGINLIGFVDAAPKELHPDLEHLAQLGPPSQLPALVDLFDIERVVIAFSTDSSLQSLDLIRSLKDSDLQIDIVPRLFEGVGPNVRLHTVEGVPLLGLPPLRLSRYSLLVKRTIDICAGTAGLLLLAPLLAYIALRVKLDSPGPVLYRSERIGRAGHRFRLLKFRTMKAEHCLGPEYGGEEARTEFERLLEDPARREEFDRTHKLTKDPRVTVYGASLRRTSLDELPQLINVIRGDISLVGPRPITVQEFERYGSRTVGKGAVRYEPPAYWKMQNLRPGVTGYWQIHGRSEIDYRERLRLDMLYVTGWSLKLDLLILAKTARALDPARGAY